jgi:hypothetical protein
MLMDVSVLKDLRNEDFFSLENYYVQLKEDK